MKKAFFIVALILTIIGLIAGYEAEIQWTVYLGFPLVIFFGSVAITFITRRIEAIMVGVILAAIWPFFWEALKTAISTL
jgi:hypothetical protein